MSNTVSRAKNRKPVRHQPNGGSASTDKESHAASCPIVGMGASAGGLNAFKTFFTHMPTDSGTAFVLVPHLDPTHQSLMVDLLSHHTRMPVCEVTDGLAVEANRIYIIPPARYLSIHHAHLHLDLPPERHDVETAIDHFLRSLALDQQERAIGVIFSGTGSHGTIGLQAIKVGGGMTMVQAPDTADYPYMPQSAIATGTVDYILPPEDMPEVLTGYVQHAYVSGAWKPALQPETESELFGRILALLRARTDYDFRSYRKNMLMRRVLRRMSLNHINQLSEYHQLLRDNKEEVNDLFRDLLIGVTGFFREPEAFQVLEHTVVPTWIERMDPDTPIRVWVPGCATGEEAYSIAILLIEPFSAAQKPFNLQIYATDIDDEALAFARRGIYPESIRADVSPERLQRFFTRTDSHFRINKQVRESVVFAAQNLISDAPFSKLDLISCRNLLIYLEPEVQQKLISLFHFALNEDGYLLLGSAETVGRRQDLFEAVSKKWRVFKRIGPTRRDTIDFPIVHGFGRHSSLQPVTQMTTRSGINFAALTQRQLLLDYGPASALINRKHDILYFYGPTGDYLEPPTGEPTSDLIAMARQGLRIRLRAACHQAIQENRSVSDTSARVKRGGKWHACTISVKPIMEPKQAEGLLLVTFLERVVAGYAVETEAEPADESSIVSQLEYELKLARDELQGTIEDMESSNEELKASNEEVMSMNEELQSANEELESSKEELQSLNEELATINNQLEDKVDELDRANDDITNLLNSSDIATLFLDTELNIRQFTPVTGKLLGLIASDIGRPISRFASDLTGADLPLEARKVLDKLAPVDNELSTGDGHHYLRRILPYRTADNRIEGVVVTFIDITRRIESEAESRRMATVLQDSYDAITLQDFDGRILAWNRGAERLYGYSKAEALRMNIRDIVPQDKRDEALNFVQRIQGDEIVKPFDTHRLTKDGRTLEVLLTVTPLKDESGRLSAVATTEHEISERELFNHWRAQHELDKRARQIERLQRLVENLPAGAVYLDKERMTMNRAAEEITGYERGDLQTLDQWFAKLYGERAAEIRRIYESYRDAGFIETTPPIMITRKNGSQRFVEFAGYRFEDQEVWMMHDMTKRHLYEKALRKSEERLQAIMDNASEAIVVIDGDGVITDFNIAAETLFGYGADETVGRNISQLMPSPYREQHDAYMRHYRETGKSTIMRQRRELPGRRKDGLIIPLEITIAEIDHRSLYCGMIRDLTEHKSLEKEIADICTLEQERIGQDIHDGLGQQLTGLSMMATSLKHELEKHELPQATRLDEMIGYLTQAAEEARTLSHGLAPISIMPQGLSDAFSKLAEHIRMTTGINCRFESEQSVENMDVTFSMQLYRIAQEAVNNAVKYANPRNIHIKLENIHGYALTVSDDGSGFNVNDMMQKRFGLRIMRYRAGIIGFKLEIESSPGRGTAIHCRQGPAVQ
ncbi:MAG: PAS domain S-box protein [Gammaproteobacteria bacterium]